MDHYASKLKSTSAPSTQAAYVADTFQLASPTFNTLGQSGFQFSFDEDLDEANIDFPQHSSTPVQETQVPPSSTHKAAEVPKCRRGKKQKSKSTSPDDRFHETYLKLKKGGIY
jgi:hypothetical protein